MAQTFSTSVAQRRPWVLAPLNWLIRVVPTDRNNVADTLFGLNTSALSTLGFVFHINPQQMQYGRTKSRDIALTKSGYQNTYWYDREQVVQLSGTTGAFGPLLNGGVALGVGAFSGFDFNRYAGDITGGTSEAAFDITQSAAWKAFEKLKQVFDAGTSDLYSMFTDDLQLLVGPVNDFDFTRDANDPFQIRWTLVFITLVRYRILLSADRVTVPEAWTYLVKSTKTALTSMSEAGGVAKENAALFLHSSTWKDGSAEPTPPPNQDPDATAEQQKIEDDVNANLGTDRMPP
jgi:hypothetical protein